MCLSSNNRTRHQRGYLPPMSPDCWDCASAIGRDSPDSPLVTRKQRSEVSASPIRPALVERLPCLPERAEAMLGTRFLNRHHCFYKRSQELIEVFEFFVGRVVQSFSCGNSLTFKSLIES